MSPVETLVSATEVADCNATGRTPARTATTRAIAIAHLRSCFMLPTLLPVPGVATARARKITPHLPRELQTKHLQEDCASLRRQPTD